MLPCFHFYFVFVFRLFWTSRTADLVCVRISPTNLWSSRILIIWQLWILNVFDIPSSGRWIRNNHIHQICIFLRRFFPWGCCDIYMLSLRLVITWMLRIEQLALNPTFESFRGYVESFLVWICRRQCSILLALQKSFYFNWLYFGTLTWHFIFY